MNITHQSCRQCENVRLWSPTLLSAASIVISTMLATGCGGNDYSPAANAEKVACESLMGTVLVGGTVQSAAAIPAGDYAPPGQATALTGLPAFCRATVAMKPSPDSNVNVEVWMPRQNWNGRFLGTGNGGSGGAIAYTTGLVEGLKRGFAVANTDLGTAPDANQAIAHPERWRDFGYRANHEMTVAGKALVNAYYQSAPRTSYFQGCSTGGQQALMIAQRYPDDYNGIVAGAPANNRTHLHTMFVSNLQKLAAPGAHLSQAKLNMVTSNVIAACAGKDGGAPTDTFLTDPRRCSFDPDTLPKCSGTDNDSCLTTPQLAALKATWSGPVNPRTGERIFSGLAVGSESMVLGLAFQGDTISWPLQQFYMFKWALGANWDYATFDFDHDMDAVDASLASIMNANDPDLTQFKAAGGKLMMFNGTSDPGVPFQSPLEYYERVVQAQGGDLSGTQNFFRYYMVPGMGHCSSITGGPGVGDFGQPYSPFVPKDQAHDILLKLVDWVENKNAPDSIIATRYTDSSGAAVAMERTICTYPKLPTYLGGDATKASSFQCMDAPRNGVPTPAGRYLN
ncbi:Tannase and feruloyl esterase [Collimonas sp. OK607]|uniref:tannase/feruloyl esterase family alpha/beta hydrolase n=1 Tax=Collimonas sp. OK607 TaxID=1798194 RepID=UPI0008E533E7|nr:tannase/feruloyl esterase family alpha/beta hydrolase [Collimonas sp. OK607]SFB20908.1 Tannase and feruloyl esterase [Collimonas sp. OK607]